jgi:ankyrin repeat domain-containing protein 50
MTTARIYEKLYLDGVQPQNGVQRETMQKLSDRIVQLYTKTLEFLARCIQSVNARSVASTMRAFFHPSEVADMLSVLGDIETKTTAEATLCERYSIKLTADQNKEDSRQTRLQLRELMADLEKNTTTFWKKLHDDERVNILQWVSDIPYETDHYVARKGRVQGTGNWLLHHATFETWRETTTSTILWLNGIRTCQSSLKCP